MEQDKQPSEEESSLFALTFDPQTTQAEPEPAEAGQPEAPPEPVTEEKGDPEPEAKPDQPRDDAGRFAPKPKEQDAAPPAADREPQHVPVAALKDERTKRQTLEAENAQMRAFIAQMQRQANPPAQQQPAEKPDPIGALLDDPQRFVGQYVQQAVAPVQEAMIQQRIAMSRQFVAAQAQDYSEAESLLEQHVTNAAPNVKNHVAQVLRTHPNPAQWVLEQGRRLKELSEFEQWRQSRNQPPPASDPVAPAAPSAPPPSLPSSLATARGIGAPRQAETPAASPVDRTWRD